LSRRDADFRPTDRAELFAGPGAAREALRAIVWADTSVGDPERWSTDLICAARTVLAAATPMLLWWGEQFDQIHNDALTVALGDNTPAVGRPAKDCWPERWELLGPSARMVRAEGEPLQLSEVDLPLRADSTAFWTGVVRPAHRRGRAHRRRARDSH
jgi:hypothetical protein